MREMYPVVLLKNYHDWNAGEIAGFNPIRVKQLVKDGIAKLCNPEDAADLNLAVAPKLPKEVVLDAPKDDDKKEDAADDAKKVDEARVDKIKDKPKGRGRGK